MLDTPCISYLKGLGRLLRWLQRKMREYQLCATLTNKIQSRLCVTFTITNRQPTLDVWWTKQHWDRYVRLLQFYLINCHSFNSPYHIHSYSVCHHRCIVQLLAASKLNCNKKIWFHRNPYCQMFLPRKREGRRKAVETLPYETKKVISRVIITQWT